MSHPGSRPTDTPGAVLFGRHVRIELGRWIARRGDPTFYLGEAQEAQPFKDRTAVTEELARLVQIGMLDEERPRAGQRRRYFRKTTSPLWRIFLTADEVLSELPNARA